MKSCAVVDSIDCQCPQNAGLGPIVSCWGCGEDVCKACSSVIAYLWKGQRRHMRFCFRCREERRVGRGDKKAS